MFNPPAPVLVMSRPLLVVTLPDLLTFRPAAPSFIIVVLPLLFVNEPPIFKPLVPPWVFVTNDVPLFTTVPFIFRPFAPELYMSSPLVLI